MFFKMVIAFVLFVEIEFELIFILFLAAALAKVGQVWMLKLMLKPLLENP